VCRCFCCKLVLLVLFYPADSSLSSPEDIDSAGCKALCHFLRFVICSFIPQMFGSLSVPWFPLSPPRTGDCFYIIACYQLQRPTFLLIVVTCFFLWSKGPWGLVRCFVSCATTVPSHRILQGGKFFVVLFFPDTRKSFSNNDIKEKRKKKKRQLFTLLNNS
jgi:hypothetical protein